MPKVSEEHLDKRRQQIVDAAARCFARKGIHPTTMQDIFRESGLSAGAIYRYFDSKEALVAAIADDWHAWERALIRDASDAEHAGSGLQQLAHALFVGLTADSEQQRRRIGIELWAEALHNPAVLAFAKEGVDEPLRMLTGIIEAAQQRGELVAPLAPEALGRVMVALFQGFILQQSWDDDVDVKSYLTALDWLLQGLFETR